MLWLYLHFPHLLLDHVRRASQTPGATVIVSSSPAQVRQACPIARQLGIHPGMRLKTALSLAPEELAVIQPEPNQAQVILEQQANWLYRYAAQVVPYSPDGLLLEAGSLLRLYGSLDNLWHTLEQAAHARRLTVRFATGATPKAARLLAQASQGVRSPDTTLLTQAIGQLPLAAAELDAKTLERLTRLGLTILKEVFQLPPKELARRLTPDTLTYVQRIRGTRPDPQHFWQPPHRFHQQADFVREVEHAQGLLFPLRPMLNELEEDLQWRQADTDRLTLTLTHRDGTAQRLSISRSCPDHRASTFLELTRLRLESCPLASPVTAMALTVTRFIPRRTPSAADLFGETADSREAWQALISRLQARLGEPALQQLTLNADHRPECAWSIAQLHPSEAGGALPTLTGPFTRPLWLLAAPHPLQQTPEQWLSGPERICSGWWDDHQIQRDYYAVQLPGGEVAWVFRDARGDWFIHGWFG